MKYTTVGYRTDVMIELGLKIECMHILNWFDDFRFTGNMETITLDGRTYYWLLYSKVAEELPWLTIDCKDKVRKIKNIFKNCGILKVLDKKIINRKNSIVGTYSYFAINYNVYNRLIEKVDPDYINEYPTRILTVDEMLCDEVWKLYPNKTGKQIAINKISKLLKELGKDQLIRCINRYLDEEGEYKSGATFFTSIYTKYTDSNYMKGK